MHSTVLLSLSFSWANVSWFVGRCVFSNLTVSWLAGSSRLISAYVCVPTFSAELTRTHAACCATGVRPSSRAGPRSRTWPNRRARNSRTVWSRREQCHASWIAWLIGSNTWKHFSQHRIHNSFPRICRLSNNCCRLMLYVSFLIKLSLLTSFLL